MGRFVDGAVVDAWLLRLRDALADLPGFAGMWLHGSAATGDWVAGVSDVDVLIGWTVPLASAERIVLRDVFDRSLRACPGGNADIHVVTLSVAAEPPHVPPYELYAGRHPVDDDEPAFTGRAEDIGLLFDLASARASGITIAGPQAQEVFGEVPVAWLVEAADHELAEWEGYDQFRQPHMAVLQAARAWLLAVEGRLASKVAAGRWAAECWSRPDPIMAALARQRGNKDVVVDEVEARSLIAHARCEIGSRTQP